MRRKNASSENRFGRPKKSLRAAFAQGCFIFRVFKLPFLIIFFNHLILFMSEATASFFYFVQMVLLR